MAAYEKCHDHNINWVNGTDPALNANNLNYEDECIDELDDRTVAMSLSKMDRSEGQAYVDAAEAAAEEAEGYRDSASSSKYVSEGYANGTADGEAITDPTSPYYHNNAKWWKEQAEAVASQSLGGLTDVDIDTPQNGQALVYDEANEVWVNAEVEAAAELSELTDVAISTPTDGQALVYDADSGKWVNSDGGSSITVVDNLTSTSATDALSAKQGNVLNTQANAINTELGFNLWDEEWEVGGLHTSTGANSSENDRIRTRGFIPIIPNTSYCIHSLTTGTGNGCQIWFYDANMVGLSRISGAYANKYVFTTPSNAAYVRFNFYAAYGTTYKHDTCINLSSSENGTYKPFSGVRKQISAISNRNLLDNPWFTVNQRGQSSYTNNTYTVDRWRQSADNGTVEVVSGGIKVTGASGATWIYQRLDSDIKNMIVGKTVTMTVVLTAVTGTIRFTFPDGTTKDVTSAGTYSQTCVVSAATTDFGSISPRASSNCTIRAVKLELGSVSTLANDVAPDYGEELRKCQRYFVRLSGNNRYCGSGQVTATTSAVIWLPVAMREATLSASVSATKLFSRTSNQNISSIAAANVAGGVELTVTTTGLTAGYGAMFHFDNGGGYIDISAEL